VPYRRDAAASLTCLVCGCRLFPGDTSLHDAWHASIGGGGGGYFTAEPVGQAITSNNPTLIGWDNPATPGTAPVGVGWSCPAGGNQITCTTAGRYLIAATLSPYVQAGGTAAQTVEMQVGMFHPNGAMANAAIVRSALGTNPTNPTFENLAGAIIVDAAANDYAAVRVSTPGTPVTVNVGAVTTSGRISITAS